MVASDYNMVVSDYDIIIIKITFYWIKAIWDFSPSEIQTHNGLKTREICVTPLTPVNLIRIYILKNEQKNRFFFPE